jgi:PRTRC genetic system protein A
VRGLPPLYPSVTLQTGRLPNGLWGAIVAIACAWARAEREVLLAITHDVAAGYRLLRPGQLAGRTKVVYRPVDDVVLELHSHHRFPAFFSATDNADEQALRLYGVLGRLDTDRPQVALRVGAFGYFLPVPWETVFAGELGPFRDRSVAEETADDPCRDMDGQEDVGDLSD